MYIHVEVWLAAAMLHEAGHSVFPPSRLVEEVERQFGDIRSGVSVYVHAHGNASAPRNTHRVKNYLIRTPTGDHRLYRPGDQVHPSREGFPTCPRQEDVDEKHWDLWRRWVQQVN